MEDFQDARIAKVGDKIVGLFGVFDGEAKLEAKFSLARFFLFWRTSFILHTFPLFRPWWIESCRVCETSLVSKPHQSPQN